MNRFELLELMYKIVTENEQLTKRCDELERQLGYGGYRSARESPRGYYDEPRTVSRRDEILARMDEQSSVPRTRREADVLSGMMPHPQGGTVWRTPGMAPAARRASQPAEEEHAPSRVRQSPAPAARPQQRPAAQPKAPASRPAPQAQPAPRAPVRSAQMPPDDDFDIDSILEDYFSDLPFDGKGRDA